MVAEIITNSEIVELESNKGQSRPSLRYLWGNWKLVTGVALITILLVFSIVGSLQTDFKHTRVGWGDFGKPPSAKYPLGTDDVGRDMYALMVHGIHQSLKIGLIAGILSTVVGTILGLLAGY